MIDTTELIEQFRREATTGGAMVFKASNGRDAKENILKLALEHNVKRVVTSESGLLKNLGLRKYLENAGMLRGYTSLLDDPEWKDRVKIISGNVFDFSLMPFKLSHSNRQKPLRSKKVTYHDPCHLKRGLGIYNEPRQLLEREGFEIVEMADADACCGFGNGIVLKYPELSNAVLQWKLDNIEATGVDTVVTSCAPCILHLRGGLDKRKSNTKVAHIANLLAEQYE